MTSSFALLALSALSALLALGGLDGFDGLDDLGYLLLSALVYIDLLWSAWDVSDHHRKA